jgi:hypothetical protein
METQTKIKRYPWLAILIILWNIIDIVVHIPFGMVEPLRVSGSIAGIAATLIVFLSIDKQVAAYILGVATLAVVSLNTIHVYNNGTLIPILVFIGPVLISLLWAQSLSQKKSEYLRWWAMTGVTAIGILLIAMVGKQGMLFNAINQSDERQSEFTMSQDGSEEWGGYRPNLYNSPFPTERMNLNGTKAVLHGGLPLGTTVEDVAIEIIEMPYPVLLYTREPDEIFIFGGTPLLIEDYVSRADGLPSGRNTTTPYLAKHNPTTGEITTLELNRGSGVPYLGGALIHANGYVYTVFQKHLYKVEPDTMTIEVSVPLPSVGFGTIYNGLLTSSTGELILKTFTPFGGTQKILLIEPDRLETTLEMECECASPRLAVSVLENGDEYLYHLNRSQTFRWRIEPGSLTLDEDWIVGFDPTGLGVDMNDEPTSPVILDSTVYYTTNTNTNASTPMYVFWQDTEAAHTPDMPPLTGSLLAEGVEDVPGWSFTGIGGADSLSGVLFATDQANGLLVAFRLTEDGKFERLWQREIATLQATVSSGNGVIYVADLKDGVNNLLVLDVMTGEELLRIPTPAVRSSIGSIIFTENNDVYLAANEPGQPTGFLIRFYIP